MTRVGGARMGWMEKEVELEKEERIYIYIWIDRFKREFGIKLSLKLMVGRDNGCLDSRLSYIVYCTIDVLDSINHR